MGSVLAGLAAILLAIVGLLLLALIIPWFVSVTAVADPARHWAVEFRPFAEGFPGRMRFAAPSGATRARRKARRERPRPPRAASGRGARGRQRTRRMIRAAPQLLAGLLSVFRIDRLRLQGRIGLADPADTGRLFGVLMPVAFAWRGRRMQIDLQPDFSGPVLDGVAEARIRVVPIRAVPPAARFVWQVFVRRP